MKNKEALGFIKLVATITLLAGAVTVFGILNNPAPTPPPVPDPLSVSLPAADATVAGGAKPATPTAANRPAPPAVLLDTDFKPPTGRKVNVAAGANAARNLQQALDAAAPGDTLLLEAGATFMGNFVLPKKAGGAPNWIVIRSSVPDAQLPAAGSRVTPAQAARFAKLVTPNADPVLKAAPGAHHYRFVGVEFTVNPAHAQVFSLLELGNSEQKSLADVPHDLIIDRCYIHGTPRTTLRRGIALNSARTAIIDSHISDCHERGADSQAVAGWNGPGPFKIVNNYLEGAGENVMFGGADTQIDKLVPSDIEFRRNHCFKPLSWKRGHESFAGMAWSVKNLFELKHARRVLVDGNIFENNWVDAQSGFAILFTPRNQDGGNPWAVVEDVTFTNNIVRHSGGGFNILGRDDNNPSQQTQRILIQNNLVYDLGGKPWGGNGAFLTITETRDAVIDHNTVRHTGNLISAHGLPSEGFVFTNNIAPHNDYGVMGDGMSPGNVSINKYFPGLTFKKNVLAGGRSSLYPPDNFFPADLRDLDEKSFQLVTASPFRKVGTDGKDIGFDVKALEAAQGLTTLTSTTRVAGGRRTPAGSQWRRGVVV